MALLAGGGDPLAAATRGIQPEQPPTAATGASAGAQSATRAQTPAGTLRGQIPAPQPVDADAATDTPTRPAGTDTTVVFDPAQFVGPPEPPWLYGPPAPGIEEIADGLYVVTGYGGNVVARVTAEGVVIAGELTPAADTISALVAGVTDQPVSYLLQTHRHEDRPAAIPAAWRDARLVALERIPPASDAGVRVPPPLPDLTFTRGLSLFPGEAEVQVHHFAPAHTAGDAVVLFPDLGVLYAGNLVVRGMPFIDYAAGGTSRGWIETLNGILALDFETAIPGAGPSLTKGDVQVFRDRFVTLRMRAMQLRYRDLAREEALSLLQTADLDWPLLPEGPFASQSFAALYDEMAVEREEAREAAAAEGEDAVDETGARPGAR